MAGVFAVDPVEVRFAGNIGESQDFPAILDADGSLLGKYRKMHIPDDPLFYEKFYFTPGHTVGSTSSEYPVRHMGRTYRALTPGGLGLHPVCSAQADGRRDVIEEDAALVGDDGDVLSGEAADAPLRPARGTAIAEA